MFLRRTPRSTGLGRLATLVLPATLLIVAGCTSSAGPSIAAPLPPPASVESGLPAIGAPVGQIGTTVAPVPGTGVVGSGTLGVSSGSAGASGSNVASGAIAYPFPGYAGINGVAPDHTIVVVGSGQAPLKSDGSDRASAERVAVAAALLDARALADSAARAAGVSITGVSSISISVGESYIGVIPMTGGAEPNIAPGAPAVPAPTPAAPELSVTVTVAYRIG
jgi:hypothetical protein